MIRARVNYTGRVQGVGFRATARDVAAGFNITGWVRNEGDGSVTLEAQGEVGAVEGFLAAVRERLGRFIRGETRDQIASVPEERGPFRVER